MERPTLDGTSSIETERKRGFFLSIDGSDGVGKSTQVSLLSAWLREAGFDVVVCRDPGSTPLGEAIRQIVLHRRDLSIHRRAEMLLYMAARSQLVEEIIRPALARGALVVSDRFLLANVVYQGYGGGLNVDELWRVGETAVAGVMPDLVLLLDLPPEVAASRIDRPPDRMESQGREFHTRVREGFLAEAARHPDHIVVVDASRSIEEVQASLRAILDQRLCQWREAPDRG